MATNRTRLTLAAFTMIFAADVSAGGIFARALKLGVPRDLVKSVAQHSTARVLDSGETASGDTPRKVIERLCGSVQDGYVDALQEANGLHAVDLDAPIGSANAPVKYPACLYVYDAQTRGEIEVKVQAGDSAARIFTRLTGKAPEDAELESYFGLPIRDLEALQPGDVLKPRYITQPVLFTASGPKAAESAFLLLQEIDSAPGVAEVETAVGRLVVPVESGRIAGSSRSDCVRNQTPLDGPAVERALIYSRQRGSRTTEVNVLIVDNGFLGADPTSGLFAGSPFSQELFQLDADTHIAKAYRHGGPRNPIIAQHGDGDPTIRGHGTHVAGLVLGGPGFPGRGQSKLPLLDGSLRITVLNVADGSATPIDGAEGVLHNEINTQTPWVVNMSLAYDGRGNDVRARGVQTTFQSLIRERPTSFFVVAAGNDRGNAKALRVYPAMLGGDESTNLVSVAALDGSGQIADFSNWGTSIDLAAPGCEIESWMGNTQAVTRLSGTSQAAPLVTFVAALVRHLLPRSLPIDLKARLIASGNLLGREDRQRTAFWVSLNPTVAMYVFDDYLQWVGSQSAYLGRVKRVEGLECPPNSSDSGPHPAEHLWAVKRAGALLMLFPGKDLDSVELPCEARVAADAHVVISPRYTVGPSGTTEWNGPAEITIPIEQVANLVFASKQR